MLPEEHLRKADGCDVLVRQTTPPSPGTPITRRGVLRVVEIPGESAPRLTIAMSFPSVFTSPQEEHTFLLDDAGAAALLATESNGAYEYTFEGSFDDLRTRVPVAKVMKPER